MNNLVQRLRDNADIDEADGCTASVITLEREAADRIAQLEEELAKVTSQYSCAREIQRYDHDKVWGMEKHELGDYVQYDDHAAIVAQLEADLAQSQAALKMAREWSKGDKWRFSEVAQEYAAWENYVDVLDAAIKEQGK